MTSKWGITGSLLRRNHAIVFVFQSGDENGLDALETCFSSVENRSVREQFNTMLSVAIMSKRDQGLDPDFQEAASQFFMSHPVDGTQVKT